MALRNNKVLKLLSIALFVFGLVAPIVAADLGREDVPQPGHKVILPLEVHGLLSQLLFEENSNEEERETRDDKHQSIALACLLPDNQVLDGLFPPKLDGYNSRPVQQTGTHPALFRLYRTFLI